jgi:hypothetical protein
VEGAVAGKPVAHAVDDEVKIVASSESGIVQRTNWPFCIW